jgi:orotate phosphoribosyltransferase
MDETAKLKRILIDRSVKTGHFVLASGQSSSVYIDARLTTMHPDGMLVIGSLSLQVIEQKRWQVDSVGGLTIGADPVAFAISYTSAMTSRPLRAFTVRKQAKMHGTGNLIEGPFQSDDNVLIVEDVITTGKSALQAIDAVRNRGSNVIGVLAVVDRMQGGVETITRAGVEVTCLTSIDDLTG